MIPIGDADALVAALREARAGRIAAAPDGAGPFKIAAVLPRIVAAYRAVMAGKGARALQHAALPQV